MICVTTFVAALLMAALSSATDKSERGGKAPVSLPDTFVAPTPTLNEESHDGDHEEESHGDHGEDTHEDSHGDAQGDSHEDTHEEVVEDFDYIYDDVEEEDDGSYKPPTDHNYYLNGADWSARFETCGVGYQSPIDLGGFHFKETVARPISYYWEPIKLNGYHPDDPNQRVDFPDDLGRDYPKPYTRFFGENTFIQTNVNFIPIWM